jgi:hypothetical protein
LRGGFPWTGFARRSAQLGMGTRAAEFGSRSLGNRLRGPSQHFASPPAAISPREGVGVLTEVSPIIGWVSVARVMAHGLTSRVLVYTPMRPSTEYSTWPACGRMVSAVGHHSLASIMVDHRATPPGSRSSPSPHTATAHLRLRCGDSRTRRCRVCRCRGRGPPAGVPQPVQWGRGIARRARRPVAPQLTGELLQVGVAAAQALANERYRAQALAAFLPANIVEICQERERECRRRGREDMEIG